MCALTLLSKWKGRACSLILTLLFLTLIGFSQDNALAQLKDNQANTESSINKTSDKTIAYEQAIVFYDRALTVEPNATDTLTNKGLILIELLRYEEAIDVFDKILSIDPKNVDGLYNKGVALERVGLIEEADRYYDIVYELAPGYMPQLINRVSESLDIVEAEPTIGGQFENDTTPNSTNISETELGLNETIAVP